MGQRETWKYVDDTRHVERASICNQSIYAQAMKGQSEWERERERELLTIGSFVSLVTRESQFTNGVELDG